jgi:hypothetical protein
MQELLRKFMNILLIIFVLNSCGYKDEYANEQKSFIDFYEVLNDNLELKFYIEKKTNFKGGLRTDSIFILNQGKKEFEKVEILKQNKDKLYFIDSKNTEYLFFIKKVDTILFVDHEGAVFKTQFFGFEDIVVKKKIYHNALKFKKEDLSIDGITTYIYFDDNYKLIREEFIEGYHSYFRIDKIDEDSKLIR